ncbi:MAG: hypothetical protein ABF274_11480 [Nonlabens sp.]|uniref:hypothetical protein n=1 Tax=Nonlabens sp. TaxID=1888209 RepID=UPI003219E700
MSLFDFKKVPVKTRLIYGLLMAILSPFFVFLINSFLLDTAYGIYFYVYMAVIMFIVGFFTIKLRPNNNKD